MRNERSYILEEHDRDVGLSTSCAETDDQILIPRLLQIVELIATRLEADLLVGTHFADRLRLGCSL